MICLLTTCNPPRLQARWDNRVNIVAENETVIKTLTEKIENDEKTIRTLEKTIASQNAILLENIELNNIICEQDKKISELIQHNNELALVCYDNFDMNGDPILVVIDIRNETTDAVYKMRRSTNIEDTRKQIYELTNYRIPFYTISIGEREYHERFLRLVKE